MGRVAVTAKIENMVDMVLADRGMMRPEEVRVVQVEDALVDTGSTFLALPGKMIRELGFSKPFDTRESTTAMGKCMTNIYGPVKLTVQGRFCQGPVSEVHDDCPVLIGQIPLEMMDFVVDPSGQELIGNPRHNGKWMLELY